MVHLTNWRDCFHQVPEIKLLVKTRKQIHLYYCLFRKSPYSCLIPITFPMDTVLSPPLLPPARVATHNLLCCLMQWLIAKPRRNTRLGPATPTLWAPASRGWAARCTLCLQPACCSCATTDTTAPPHAMSGIVADCGQDRTVVTLADCLSACSSVRFSLAAFLPVSESAVRQ